MNHQNYVKKERLDRELEIGAEIQLRLLPRQCPTIPVCPLHAANLPTIVGGDYYDFICTNQTRFSRIQR